MLYRYHCFISIALDADLWFSLDAPPGIFLFYIITCFSSISFFLFSFSFNFTFFIFILFLFSLYLPHFPSSTFSYRLRPFTDSSASSLSHKPKVNFFVSPFFSFFTFFTAIYPFLALHGGSLPRRPDLEKYQLNELTLLSRMFYFWNASCDCLC